MSFSGTSGFTTIGYASLPAKSEDDVLLLFRALGDEELLTIALSILPKSSVLKQYQSIYKKEIGEPALIGLSGR